MELFYREKGKGEKTIIIVHGLYGASDNWLSVAKALENDFRIILVDQRNHGQSPHSNNHSYQAMVQDIYELMQRLKIEKAILMGHSMGGKSVMRFCLEHPEMVEKLIVVDIAPKSYGEFSNYAEVTADHHKIIDTLSSIDPSVFKERQKIDEALKEHFPQKHLRAFFMKNLRRRKDGHYEWKINLDALRNNMKEIMDGFSGLPPKTGKKMPEAIFIRGEESPYIHEDDSMSINKFFPGSQIVNIPGAGHWVHAEKHDMFIKTVKYFLEG